jgi:hypothetical protein
VVAGAAHDETHHPKLPEFMASAMKRFAEEELE